MFSRPSSRRNAASVLASMSLMPLALPLTSCRTDDFLRSTDPTVDFAPFLSTVIDASNIRAWHDDPPQTLGPDVAVHYVVELEEAGEREQWLARFTPCSDRQAKLRSDLETDDPDSTNRSAAPRAGPRWSTG